MLLKASIFTALLAAAQTLALPSSTSDAADIADNSLVIIDTYETSEGTITIYGANPAFLNTTKVAEVAETTSNGQLARRCGSNVVTCDTKNVPALNSCKSLINLIEDSLGIIFNSPRPICLTRNGEKCCISWNKDLGPVYETNFYHAAKRTMDLCVGDKRSGLANDVSINGRCLRQCLSNRATGC